MFATDLANPDGPVALPDATWPVVESTARKDAKEIRRPLHRFIKRLTDSLVGLHERIMEIHYTY